MNDSNLSSLNMLPTTSHMALLSPLISPRNSNFLKSLNTIRLQPKPTLSYQEKLLEAEEIKKHCSDKDLRVYKSTFFESRKTEAIFKQLRRVTSGRQLPSVIRNDSAEAEKLSRLSRKPAGSATISALYTIVRANGLSYIALFSDTLRGVILTPVLNKSN